MPGYVLVTSKPNSDPEQYARYFEKGSPTLAAYGAKVLVAGRPIEQLEGRWTPFDTFVVLQFTDVETARSWYHSPGYTEARALREGLSDAHFVLMEEIIVPEIKA